VLLYPYDKETAMLLDQNNPSDPFYRPWNLKNGLGYLLILSGLGAAFGILVEIYSLFVDPQELAVFRQLFPERMAISWEGGLVAVPPEILAYGLPLLLLSLAGGVATTLLNAGISLLQSKR
jgi:hypothetical protein